MKISIVYHSGKGHTEAQAKAVAKGAQSVAGIEVVLMPVSEVNWEVLDASDAIIFGSPTYMGTISAEFKRFMDDSVSVWFGQKWKNKYAAGFTNSGQIHGDKLNTLMQFVLFAAQQSMHWINLGVISEIPAEWDEEEKQDLNRIGGWIGAMSQSQHGEDLPVAADLKTAEYLGRRVANVISRK